MNALASSLSRCPFTNLAASGARPAIPAAAPGPACDSLRPYLPVPPDLRLRDRHHLAEHDRAARADPLRAPMASADRSASPRSLPLFSGEASNSAGTATIIPGERARHAAGQGKKTREAPAGKSEI